MLPASCLACREPVFAADGKAGLGLCAACLGRLEEAPAGGCPTCGAPPAGNASGVLSCTACRSAPRSYRRLLWGWNYAPPMDAVIAGLKFRRLDYLGRQLGAELGCRFAAEVAEADVVTAVPLGFWRRLGRGYDQAEAIATAVAAAGEKGGRRCVRLLTRRRATAPQSLAGAGQRQRNLAGAFAATAAVARKWRGCHILLVDDVITTGATLEAASRALLEGGAGAVTVLAAARTPAPAEPTSAGRE